MPKAGKLVVGVSPADARAVASWLRILPPSLWGVRNSNAPILPNGIRQELVDKFDAIADRKRRSGSVSIVNVEIDREDAEWLAAKVRGGMMFGGFRLPLPTGVRAVCIGCSVALRKKRGRRRLYGEILRKRGRQQLDARHLKRLRARERVEDADKRFWASWEGVGSALFKDES